MHLSRSLDIGREEGLHISSTTEGSSRHQKDEAAGTP
jgi:hypothetical protein